MTSTTRAHFEGLVNEAIWAVAPAGDPRAALTLTQVEGLRSGRQTESFRLAFQGPGAPGLEQGLFFLEHARLPREAVFIVPVGRTAEGFLYEAIFNRG